MVDLNRLRDWHEALQIGELDPTDPDQAALYVAMQEAGHSVVDEIRAAIQLSAAGQSVHLVSGPRGSGKSTELLRLKEALSNDGYKVVRFDLLDYVSETQPLEVEIFLVVMGLAVTEGLMGDEAGQAGFVDRLQNWLTSWRPTEATVEGGVGGAGIEGSVGVTFERDDDLHRELRQNPNFVAFLRDRVSFYLRDLKERVDDHLRDLSRDHGGPLPLVIIVDSLERIGVSPRTDGGGASTMDLFVNHSDKLRFPGAHVVYTVPPMLPVRYPGLATNIANGVLCQIAVPRVLGPGEPVESAGRHGAVELARFVDAVDRRVDNRADLVDDTGLERIVRASGGHLDDLFNLLTRLINLTLARSATTPVDATLVEAAVADVRANLAPRTEEQVETVRWVEKSGWRGQPPADLVPQLAQLLSSHLVLHRRNDHDWYEVHPLALEALEQGPEG